MTDEPADTGPPVWSLERVRALGVTTDLVTAATILGIGRTTAHALARADRFPVPVIRVGHRYRVPTAPILQLLALPAETPLSHPAAPARPAIISPAVNTSTGPLPDTDDAGAVPPQARHASPGGDRPPD